MLQIGERFDCPVESIITDDANPTSRTKNAAIKLLANSIKARGRIIYPLLITSDYRLKDGHRRLAAARLLGMNFVPVQIVEDDDDLFSEINITHRPMKRFEWLERYLDGGDLPLDVHGQITRLEALIGRDKLVQMRRDHIGPSVSIIAVCVVRYVGGETTDDVFLKQVLLWLIDGRRQSVVYAAIKSKIPPSVVYKAIQSQSDLRPAWTTDVVK